MSEASFDMVLQELRDTAPAAPEALRERVRGLREPAPKRRLRLRPALVAIPIAVIGVALIGALIDSSERGPTPVGRIKAATDVLQSRGATTESDELRALAPSLTSKSRLQQQQVSMRLRVDDLSGEVDTGHDRIVAHDTAVGRDRQRVLVVDAGVGHADRHLTGGEFGLLQGFDRALDEIVVLAGDQGLKVVHSPDASRRARGLLQFSR